MKTLSEFLGWFAKQKLSGKLVIGFAGLLLLFCMCGSLSALFTRTRQPSSAITPTYQEDISVVMVTWTPAGTATVTQTSSATTTSTPASTRTPLPTGLPTRGLETATLVILPSPTAPPTSGGLVIITYVNKEDEYVDIQNAGTVPVDLSGWVLVSENGDQSCRLKGILQSKAVLRIWAGTGTVGYSCGFTRTIWNNNELDPAVLYNRKGEEVSRYP